MPETLAFERFEFKYFAPEPMIDEIRDFCAPYVERDEYAAKEPSGRYCINNLYWDTRDLAFYWAHSRGDADRFKLRVRSYGDGRGPKFLEVKRKIRQVIVKHRSMIANDAYDAVVAGDWEEALRGSSNRYLHEFLGRAALYGAEPNFGIRYEREAYKSVFGDEARLTFDRKISYQRVQGKMELADEGSTDLAAESPSWIYVEGPPERRCGVLIELKFSSLYPRWMSELVRQFSLTRLQFSKYLTAVNHDVDFRLTEFNSARQSVLGRLGTKAARGEPSAR